MKQLKRATSPSQDCDKEGGQAGFGINFNPPIETADQTSKNARFMGPERVGKRDNDSQLSVENTLLGKEGSPVFQTLLSMFMLFI